MSFAIQRGLEYEQELPFKSLFENQKVVLVNRYPVLMYVSFWGKNQISNWLTRYRVHVDITPLPKSIITFKTGKICT